MNLIQLKLELFSRSETDRARSRKGLLWLLEALTQVNLQWLKTHKDTPLLYGSGVVYKPERNTEIWQDIPTIIKAGFGDCEDLACWRAAELKYAGIAARPYIKWRLLPNKKTWMYHAVVRLPNTKIEDPSLALGMSDHPVVSKPVFTTP